MAAARKEQNSDLLLPKARAKKPADAQLIMSAEESVRESVKIPPARYFVENEKK